MCWCVWQYDKEHFSPPFMAALVLKNGLLWLLTQKEQKHVLCDRLGFSLQTVNVDKRTNNRQQTNTHTATLFKETQRKEWSWKHWRHMYSDILNLDVDFCLSSVF